MRLFTPQTVQRRYSAKASGTGADRDGFEGITLTGIFLADVPVDCHEGATGDQVLELLLPDDVDLDYWEIVDDGPRRFREWCVPSELLNSQATVRLVQDFDAV